MLFGLGESVSMRGERSLINKPLKLIGDIFWIGLSTNPFGSFKHHITIALSA